jgi:glutamine synthetase type III
MRTSAEIVQEFIKQMNEVREKINELDETIMKVICPMPEYQEKLLLMKEYERLERMIGLK